MTPPRRRLAAIAAAIATAIVPACASHSAGPAQPGAGKPVKGGTLKFVSSGDFDHVDTLSAYYQPSSQLEQAWTRQLVSYYPSNNPVTANTLAPDAATSVPTRANGGISSDGLTYTFTIKKGVMWDTTPPRQVTSQDFEREFKAMCNPTLGVGNPLYYVPVIKGMSGYCAAYAAAVKPATATPAAEARFQDTHSISGISTPTSLEIQFTLTQAANDFLNILAMPFASARPVEYDSYLPDSAQFRQHTLSDGPYQITTYIPNKKIILSKNPAWKQSTDGLRHQYVNQIVVNEGTSSNGAAMADIEADTDDLMWDLVPPTDQIPQLEATHNPGLHVYTDTGSESPYLVFNEQSPDAGHAMSKFLVREAIEYAINKVAIAKIYGGTRLNPVLNEAIAPGNAGYTSYDYYPTPNNSGDPARCKALLAKAGYPHGMSIIDVYRNAANHPAVFQQVQSDLMACGITVKGIPQEQGPYYSFLENTANSKKPNQWDISEPGWGPDWLGNNGRSNVVPLFQTNCGSITTNYGCYSDPKTDNDIKQALMAPNAATADPFWAQAGQQVMRDAAIVPLTTQDVVLFVNSHVHGLIYNPEAEQYNVTQLWLSTG